MTGPRRRGLTIKAALALSFGATLGLWLFAGYYFSQRMADLQRESADVNRRYMQAQELLSGVRARVLLGSVYVRDALLDSDPGAVARYREQMQETYDELDRTLQQYVPVLNTQEEQQRVETLRREINGFRLALLNVLATDSRQWPIEARRLLSDVTPRRASVMAVSDNIQKLNRSAYVQQQQAVAAIYGVTQRRVWEALALALAASLGIALLATIYVMRLERELQRQRTAQVQMTDDLQRLSTELLRVQEEERRTIARELHDEVGQVLMAIKVELALAERRVEAAGGPERLLADATAITDGALHTVRDLTHLLHPALLDDLGLPAALNWYTTGFGNRHGLAIEFLEERMDERLVPEIEAAAYRIVQEALTNVVKHSKATLALVYLRRAADVIQLCIEDNGIGFEPASERRGLGLLGMRERAAHLGGTVRIDSAPGTGTRLTVELPARRRARLADESELPAPEAALPSLSTSEVLRG